MNYPKLHKSCRRIGGHYTFASDCARDSIFYDKVEGRRNVPYGGTVWQPFSTHVGD